MIAASSNGPRYERHRTLEDVHSAPETGDAGSIRGVHHLKGFRILASGRAVANESMRMNSAHRKADRPSGSPCLRLPCGLPARHRRWFWALVVREPIAGLNRCPQGALMGCFDGRLSELHRKCGPRNPQDLCAR
jgi:hypothetical protein